MSNISITDQAQSKDRIWRLSIIFLFLLASGFLILLVSFNKNEVFYSGDAGLKFMSLRQITLGEDFRYITHTQPAWVDTLWNHGYFPIRDNFVAHHKEGHYYIFAPSFQLLNAPMYKNFSYTGLYLIPLFSVLLLWAWFIYTAKKLNLSNQLTAILFFILAFCSPITMYGAIYWEHTLATLMCFASVYYMLIGPRNRGIALLLGLSGGLAFWLRPESLWLNGFMMLLIAIQQLRNRKLEAVNVFFAVGVVLGWASFLAFNKAEFGALFGVHGSQALDKHNYFLDFKRIKVNVHYIGMLMVTHFTVCVLLFPAIILWLRSKWTLSPRLSALFIALCLFAGSAPLLFPNEGGKQWGPRFYLPIMPLILLLLAAIFREWQNQDWKKLRWPLAIVLILAIANSFYLNVYVGPKNFREDCANRVLPALEAVKADSGSYAIVDNPDIPMELGAIFREKNFFYTPDSTRLSNIIGELKSHGIDHFTFIHGDGDEVNPNLTPFLAEHNIMLEQKGSYKVARFPIK